MNQATDIEPSLTSSKPLKVAQRRAEALNRLYGTQQARPSHSVWFTKHELPYLPLVKAITRIIGAERNLVGGRDEWNAVQLTDLRSINRILSTSSQIIAANPSSSSEGSCFCSGGIGQRKIKS